MDLVVVESPYAGETQEDIEQNLQYLRCCMHDCIMRGESPYASHGLLTQPGVLNDRDPTERKLGIEAGIAWKNAADKTVVYTDLGVTTGMAYGIDRAETKGQMVEYRQLGDGWQGTRALRTDLWGK